MKRDWELVREILIAVEAIESHKGSVSPATLPERDKDQVNYHIHIMKEAGLISANCSGAIGFARQCKATELTWEGHEFLDQVRSRTVWNKTVGMLQEKGLDLSFSTIKAAAAAVAKGLIGF